VLQKYHVAQKTHCNTNRTVAKMPCHQNATQAIDKKHERLTPPVEIKSHPSSGNKEDNFGVTPPVEIRSHPQWK
jgi:hypothetical protein